MICDILFLYASDSDDIKDDLLRQLRGVPVHCICVDEPGFPFQETLRHFTQIKLQVVFFSPGFLNFLECKVHEAYEYFCSLDPQATVALFCCGVLERSIFCYHMAPLKSYSSWPKFKHPNGKEEGNAFDPFFIGLFVESLPDQNRSESVVIVPQVVYKGSSRVYVVFSQAVENTEKISVHIETGSRIQIAPECLNPYVLHFNVPVTLLESCQSFEVIVKQSSTDLARKVLSIVPDNAISCKGPRDENPVQKTKKITRLGKAPKPDIYNGINRSSEDYVSAVSSPEDDTNSLTDVCNIDRPLEHNAPGGKLNISKQVNSLEDTDDSDEFRVMRRTASLSSITPQQEECSIHDPDYLPMMPIYKHMNENSSSQSSLLNESNGYVSMKLVEIDGSPSDVTENKQEPGEAMQTFKNGNIPTGTAEEKCLDWWQKNIASPRNDQQGEMIVHESPFARGFNRRGIRRSKLQRSSEIYTKMDGNCSNDSASSSSSKAESNCTVQSTRAVESPVPEVPSRTIPNHATDQMGPSITDAKPCLPPKPRFLSKDPHPHKTRSERKKTGTYEPPVFIELDNSREDNEKVESLIKVCERYGLQHLGDYFMSGCSEHLVILSDDPLPKTEKKDSGEWDPDNTTSLQRSVSLPSSLFPTETMIILDDGYDDVIYPDDSTDSITCQCGDPITYVIHGISDEENPLNPDETCVSNNDQRSFKSGIYMSLVPLNPNEGVMNATLQKCTVSESQEELLNLMTGFKRGEKTISQVEEQFALWHDRHMESLSNRAKHLQDLQEEYNRAQKPYQGVSRIKKFILGKPKPRKKDNKKTTDENERSSKKKVGKTNSDSKRLSKISSASTSSGGVSDTCEVVRHCYDNPGYANTRDIRGNNSFKPYCSPPPLPHRPLLTPIPLLKPPDFGKAQNSEVSEDEKTPSKTQFECPPLEKNKPSPPPKPPDVLRKLRSFSTVNGCENEINEEDKQASKNADIRSISPDYIIPNKVIVIPYRRKYFHNQPNPSCPLHCPNLVSSSYPSTMVRSRDDCKDSTKRRSWTLQVKDAIQNQLAGLATQLVKTKKVEGAKFYVTRKWSSVPKLDSAENLPHSYLELVEVYDSRNRAISDITNPVD